MTAGVSRRPLDLANPADRDYALKRAVDGLREDHPL